MNIKKACNIIFEFDHILVLLLIFSCLMYFEKAVLTSLFAAYTYASLWYFLKRIIMGTPVKIYKMFFVLGIIPLTLLAAHYIQGLAG
ncbi:MAG: hypothetical protein GY793_08385 [Proteobacteria bacterium]|nr:hypothetical protein [Pseudomonadota bacterium]